MRWVAVLPFIDQGWADDCTSSMAPEFLANTLLVDNTRRNIGIMASHNRGIDRMREVDAEWLVVVSAAIRFGALGGMDFVEALAAHDGHRVVEAAGVYGWHLIAFHRSTLDAVGRWDENFTPYGFDDIDMSLRIQRAFQLDPSEQLWTKVRGDWSDAGMAHSVHLGWVRTDTNALIDYFIRKWGRHPGASDVLAHMHPFDDPANPIGYWPDTADGGRWDA